MLLALEAGDRLVRALSARGTLPADEAARLLLALPGPAPGVAAEVLDWLLARDGRLTTGENGVCLAAAPWSGAPLAEARYAVVDLETGGVGGGARIVEAAVVLHEPGKEMRELELVPGPGREQTRAVLDLLAFAGDAILCGHNLQFDLRFLDRELRTSGMRVAAPVLDTLRLARRLLSGRSERLGLGDLCELLGTPTRPEHRALTDAHAAAELLGRLLTLAEDRGARTVGDVLALARARPRSDGGPPGDTSRDSRSKQVRRAA
jgi:DNA polymerase III epsilon subunit-like protein